MGELKVSNALAALDLADEVELDCGSFDIVIRQATLANDDLKAAVARRSLISKKRKLTPEAGSMTGSFEEDVRLFIEAILVSWGERPLIDDDGETVGFNDSNLFQLFTGSREGKILFSKIQQAAVDETLFVKDSVDVGNS